MRSTQRLENETVAQKQSRLSLQRTIRKRNIKNETASSNESRFEQQRKSRAFLIEHETIAQKEARLTKNRAQINAVRDSVQKELAQARVNHQAVETAERTEVKIHPKSTHLLYRKGARDEKNLRDRGQNVTMSVT